MTDSLFDNNFEDYYEIHMHSELVKEDILDVLQNLVFDKSQRIILHLAVLTEINSLLLQKL